jgi:hypothetical protein
MLKRKKRPSPVSPFVPFARDYCDRRCEHCPITGRCLDYVVEKRVIERHGDPGDGPLDEFLAGGILDEMARELGIPAEHFEGEDPLEGLREEIEEAELEDNGRDEALSYLYDEDIYQCFCIYERQIDDQQEEINALVDALEDSPGGIPRVRRLDASLTEISWFLDLLYAKLKRAYFSDALYREGEFDEALIDANGSAKVALIAVDSSRRAWLAVRGELPRANERLDWLVAILEQLRDEIVQRFPGAPAFKRPGLDE